MPLNQGHTDKIFKQIEEFELSVLTLVPRSSKQSLQEALFSEKFDNSFSSAHVKNGGI